MENKDCMRNMEEELQEKKFQKSLSDMADEMGNGYVLMMLTDEFAVRKLQDIKEQGKKLYRKALEIRMFNDMQEAKWFRCSIDRPLRCRVIKDTAKEPDFTGDGGDGKRPLRYWDEYQYLDIDVPGSSFEEGRARATGGGFYPLPLKGCADVDDPGKTISSYCDVRIKLRNYLRYEEDTGRVSVADWRLVGFTAKEGGNGNV